MAKRGLSMLLAILTVFALAAPAFAASGSIGGDLKWYLSGGTVTISGTGDMYEYYEPDEWKDNQDLFENVIIESGVTGIRPNAFSYCENLKSVTLPDTLTRIGNSAFQECHGLTAVSIPGSVDTIESKAFAECYSLKDVTIGNGVRIIRESVFRNCPATSITIPDSVTVVDYSAFAYCQSLKSMTFPKSVVAIGGDVFWGCTSLKDVTVLNPECLIDGEEDTLGTPGTTVIYGYPGSTAETYAKTYGYTFKDVSQKPVQLAAPAVKIAQTTGGIQVTWNAVKGSSRYMVYYRENNGSWKKIGTTDKTSYTHAASKLKNGVTYQFTVRCCASDRKTLLGGYTASNSLTYSSQLAAPTVKIAQTTGGIQVTWNAVSGSPRYMVYYRENNGSWKKIGTTDKTSYTHAASKLKNGVTYQFTVRCCGNDRKTLLGSYIASNSLKYNVQLAAPTVKISKVSNGIQASWSAVSGSPFYMVYYRENGGSWHAVGTTYKTSYTHPASKLKNGVTYQFTVRCCGNDRKTLLGSYTPSNSLTYSSQLAAPTVKISKVSNGIQASWNAVSGSPFYMVYYRENGGSWHMIGSTYKTSYTHPASKLKNGVTYQFTVRCCGNDRKTLLGGYTASNSVVYQ